MESFVVETFYYKPHSYEECSNTLREIDYEIVIYVPAHIKLIYNMLVNVYRSRLGPCMYIYYKCHGIDICIIWYIIDMIYI